MQVDGNGKATKERERRGWKDAERERGGKREREREREREKRGKVDLRMFSRRPNLDKTAI